MASTQCLNDEVQQTQFLHSKSPSVKVDTRDMKSVHAPASLSAHTSYDIPDYDPNNTTSRSSTSISIPCDALPTPESHEHQQGLTDDSDKYIRRVYHRKLSGKLLNLLMWSSILTLLTYCYTQVKNVINMEIIPVTVLVDRGSK
jgi:hypothetical protein